VALIKNRHYHIIICQFQFSSVHFSGSVQETYSVTSYFTSKIIKSQTN